MDQPINVTQLNAQIRLLVVDRDLTVRTSLARALRLTGYQVDEADSGPDALHLLERSTYDLMVLDTKLPQMAGLGLMQQARQLQPALPIIVLTARPTIDSVISALKLEAADYLRKPIGPYQVVLTVEQALRKHADRRRQQIILNRVIEAVDSWRQLGGEISPPPASEVSSDRFVKIPPLILDRQHLQLVRTDRGECARLSEGEAAVLATLMTHHGQVLSCRYLARQALGYDTSPVEAEQVIRPHIFRLRRKIERSPKQPRLIRTVRNRGYTLTPP